MKIIDRNGRLFGKISVIDVLVILVALVMAAALYFKGQQTHTGITVTEQTIIFRIRARGVNDYVAAAIQEGDGVYDSVYSSGGRSLGEIIGIQVECAPGTKLEDLGNGIFGPKVADDTVDLLITVRGRGLVNGKNYSLNRVYDLGVNSYRTYQTKRAEFMGTVAEILDEP